jgi:hypothetical protein
MRRHFGGGLCQKQQSLRDKKIIHHTDILAADIRDFNHIR